MIVLSIASFLLWHKKIDKELWAICLLVSCFELIMEFYAVISIIEALI